MFMENGIEMETRFGDGSEPDKGFMGKLFDGAKRKLTGETLFMTWFTNKGSGKKRVAFGAPYPGKIIALDLKEIGGEYICQKDAFLCAAMGTKVGIALNKKIGAGLFGGEGFIMQRLQGDGKAFVHAGGTIVQRELGHGETLRVDTGCIVGYTPTVNYDIQTAGGLKNMVFGGEGLFLATLTGPGQIWLQSLPFSRLAKRMFAAAPQGGGKQKGEGQCSRRARRPDRRRLMSEETFQSFRERRQRANDRVLATEHKGIKRFFALDSACYRDGPLPGTKRRSCSDWSHPWSCAVMTVSITTSSNANGPDIPMPNSRTP